MSPIRSCRMIRAVALAFLTLTATLAACGGEGSGGGLTDPPSDPIPADPTPSDPTPPSEGPAPVGRVVYAVDIKNNFLVFGTESFDVLSRKVKITGVPLLKRIIGIVVRPSDGKVYGVGNDSRVYTIDPVTAVATPVGPEFSPKIASFFDIHFAMGLEPGGNRVRLIATEGRGNWSISLDDGSAVAGTPVRFAAGDPNEGESPHIATLVYATAAPAAGVRLGPAQLSSSAGPCTEVMYMIDPDLASYIGSCDPDSGDLSTLGPIGETWARCMEVMTDPDGGVIPSPDNPYGLGNTFVAAMRGIDKVNSWGTINPNGSVSWHGFTKGEAIQSAAIAPGTTGSSRLAAPEQQYRTLEPSLAEAEAAPGTPAAPNGDPRATCG
jgi:hypothetical protein